MGKLILLACVFITGIAHANEKVAEEVIYQAIRSGSAEQVEQLLGKGVGVDSRDRDGNTLLIRAALYGKTDLLRMLLDRGADVNATNVAGSTALMRAATDPDKVKLLLSRGADVQARTLVGNTALILAARAHGASPAVKLLVEAGADVNATNVFGVTPFLTAVASGDHQSVRMLLERGASPKVKLGEGMEAFIFGGGRSPLIWAAYRGDLQLIQLLLEIGADVNGQEALGTPLANAVWNDHLEAARLLLARGADVHGRDLLSDFTPLHWAALSELGNPAVTKLLLEHGAEVNAEGGEPVDAFLGIPQTPLMLAQRRGETEIVEALRSAGAEERNLMAKMPSIPERQVPASLTPEVLETTIERALGRLRESALISREAFLTHSSKQNCVSCHQQYLPMAAIGFARGKEDLQGGERALFELIQEDQRRNGEMMLQATFHPDAAHTLGYAILGLGMKSQSPDPDIDAAVFHLLAIQGREGQWHNNLPRPPMQTSDVSATALAIYALKQYRFPGREAEFASRTERAKQWLWQVAPANTEERVFQLMGLAWAGVEPKELNPLAKALWKEQRSDGGWAQLPKLQSDAYATGQALFALHLAGVPASAESYQRGLQFLLRTQFEDGAWFVARRTFPFQPTMPSGFPHGRDSWLSATGTSWASIAMAVALRE